MAYSFKKKENIGNKSTEYSRYYSAFRGVDFSSDHTQVHESRFAYLVNMYKDYKSGQGEAVETIVGFRKRATFGNDKVYGIFYFKCKVDGVETERVLVHSGTNLYLWEGYPNEYTASTPICATMNERRSSSFICNNRLYIIDGKNYLVYDGVTIKDVTKEAYIPTTYKDIIPSGKNANTGTEYEPRNMLSSYFKNTFKANGTATEYYLSEDDIDGVVFVKVYGETLAVEKDYKVATDKGKITFTTAPKAPNELGYSEGYSGVEIVASKTWSSIDGVSQEDNIQEIIKGCTLCTTFDNRVFLSGNPKYHNLLFWCRLTQGYTNPSYFGVIDWTRDGVGSSPITGLMSVSDTLMVLKADTQQDSSVYFHTGETVDNIATRIYPKSQGLSGLGCIGACRNFLDDPIFISRLGVEGVSQLKIASERTNEHRSSLIDAKLVNTDLSSVCLEEWGGYLWVLTDGKIFLADSRQRYSDNTGVMQYEWYYLEGIGVWENQHIEYIYSSSIAEELVGKTVSYDGEEIPLVLADEELQGTVANMSDANNQSSKVYSKEFSVTILDETFTIVADYVVSEDEDKAFLCESKGNYRDGEFKKATILCTMNDNVFFGCENGVVCSFNFDKRTHEGDFPVDAYSFDGRIINCGCATKMDNCQIPHLTKSTIKRSTVIKTKSFKNSVAKVKVRTNKKPYEQIARINSGLFDFGDVDFADLSFATGDNSLFAIKEKEKQWVEKQYYIYSDEYRKPFSLYYIAYRYNVAGRIKD